MLLLMRRQNEAIRINDNIKLTVKKITRGAVTFAIEDMNEIAHESLEQKENEDASRAK